MTWVWLDRAVLLAVHDEQIVEHGGASGIRDVGLFDSALSRPVNQAAYGEPDAFELGAAYAFGLVRNHPFIDGNKRIGAIAADMFLRLNGLRLVANDTELVLTFLHLAAGEIDEVDLADWLRQNAKPA